MSLTLVMTLASIVISLGNIAWLALLDRRCRFVTSTVKFDQADLDEMCQQLTETIQCEVANLRAQVEYQFPKHSVVLADEFSLASGTSMAIQRGPDGKFLAAGVTGVSEGRSQKPEGYPPSASPPG